MKIKLALFLFLALFGQVVYCDYGDEDDDYGGDGAEGGGYGGDDEDEESSPPPSGDAKELTTLKDFEEFLDNNDASVIGAFTTKEMPDPKAVKPEEWDDEDDGEWEPETIPNPALTAFNSITAELYGYRWAYTTSADVRDKLKAKSDSLFVYKSPRFVSKDHGDRPRERFGSSTLTQSAVANFLSSKAQPLVGLFSADTKERYVGRSDGTGTAKPAVCVIFMNLDWEKNGKSVQYVLKRARKVAQAHKGKLSFAIGSLSDMKYDMEDYGLTSTRPYSDVLMGIMQRTSAQDTFYRSDAESFSEKALAAFADSFLAGELTPHVKEEPKPVDDDEEEEGEDDGMDEGAQDEGKEEM